jgi:hypothetical protein
MLHATYSNLKLIKVKDFKIKAFSTEQANTNIIIAHKLP